MQEPDASVDEENVKKFCDVLEGRNDQPPAQAANPPAPQQPAQPA
jgi:hypothetical protein